MKGIIVKDWSKVNIHSPQDTLKVYGAIQAFFRRPVSDPVFKAALQAFTMKGDFPTLVKDIIEKYHATPDWDNGFEEIFDIKDFTGTNASGFKILDVDGALSFRLIPAGGKAKVYKVFGSETEVSFDMYGGAMSWDRTWLDDGQYWNIEDTMIEFRNRAYSSRAAIFYALIEALSSSYNVAWQVATPGLQTTDDQYQASRDANTIEKACEEILLALKDKGMGINAQSQFVILTPIQLRGRVNKAISRLAQPVAGAVKDVSYNVKPIYTMMLGSGSYYYVILPKKKLKGGYRMDLSLFSKFNILAYADTMSGFMRYGGAIGNSNQLRRCNIS